MMDGSCWPTEKLLIVTINDDRNCDAVATTAVHVGDNVCRSLRLNYTMP